jgi:hypothetical protein
VEYLQGVDVDDSDKISRSLNILTGGKELLKVSCLSCRADTNHMVLAVAESSEAFDDGRNSMEGWAKHQIIECQGCNTISYRTTSAHSEDWDHDHFGNMRYNEKEVLYPSRTSGRTAIIDAYMLPIELLRIYEEVISAMNNNLPVLAGIGIRALVETICKDKQAPKGDLEAKINALVDMKVLTPEGATILHQLRTLGNKSAHEVLPHTPEQLGVALSACEHLMEGVYVLPAHAKNMLPKAAERQK